MSNITFGITPTPGSIILPTDTITITISDYLGVAPIIMLTVLYPTNAPENPYVSMGLGPTPTTPATVFTSAYSAGSSITASGAGTDISPFVTTIVLVRTGGFPQPPTILLNATNTLDTPLGGAVYMFDYPYLFTAPAPGGNIVVTVSPSSGSTILPTDTLIVTVQDDDAPPNGALPAILYPSSSPESPFATFGGGPPTFNTLYSGSTWGQVGDSQVINLVRGSGGFPEPPTLVMETIDDSSNVQVFEFSWVFGAPSPVPPLPASTPLRMLAAQTYQSIANGQIYRFDVTLDSNGNFAVRNILGPYGPILDSWTSLPNDVVENINQARNIMIQQLAEKQATSGTLSFTGQTSQTVNIAPGLLNNTFYRVIYSTPDGTPMWTTDMTPAGFTANVATSYGTSLAPISVPYVVLAATQQSSVLSGTLTFSDCDGGVRTVLFPLAMATNKYRVVLSPNGLFTADVLLQTRTSMKIQLGYSLEVGETVTVGFDIFV